MRTLVIKALCFAVFLLPTAPVDGQATATIDRSPVAPTDEEFRQIVQETYEKYKDLKEGENADYIPELAVVDPELFSISVVTIDGRTLSVGDSDYVFSIQSISKVFTLALLMNEKGPNEVLDKLGAEPTGLPFNSVIAVEQQPTHVGNPLVNAGAIATTSLISAPNAEEKYEKILTFYSDCAGEKLTLLNDVYESEAATNTRNQAIARLLMSYGKMYSDPSESVDVYTKQCSIGVNSEQLAMMGATLAAGGRNPITGKQVIQEENIPELLAVMTMAGMYDYSGTWAFLTGLPAKSGVGGGILAVVPGKGAIAAFSPRLDRAGNSIRAQRAIADISERLGINLFSPRSVGVE